MHVSIQVRPLVALDELLIFIWDPAWLAQPARAVTQVPAPRLSTEGGTYQRALVASGRYLPPPSVAARHEAMTIADQALTDAPLTQPRPLRDSLLHAPTSNTSFVAWSAWWRFLLHIKSTLQTGFSISGVLEKAAGPCTHTHNPPQLSRVPGNITPLLVKMLLRLRGPDGQIRLEVNNNETFGQLGEKVYDPNERLVHPTQTTVLTFR